jgi:hypothetical protein
MTTPVIYDPTPVAYDRDIPHETGWLVYEPEWLVCEPTRAHIRATLMPVNQIVHIRTR